MAQDGRQRLGRLALEGLVIVLSILLAFWIEAAWDLRRDRTQAQEYLEAVKNELVDNIEILDEHVLGCERGTLAAQRQFVALMGPTPPVISTDSVTFLAAWSLRGVPPRLEHAAFDALISSGALSDIDSSELQREFRRWRTTLDGRESRRAIYEDRVVKTLDLFMDLGIAANIGEGSRVDMPASRFPFDVEALLSDPVLAGAITLLGIRKGQVCQDDVRRGERAEEFLRVVLDELER